MVVPSAGEQERGEPLLARPTASLRAFERDLREEPYPKGWIGFFGGEASEQGKRLFRANAQQGAFGPGKKCSREKQRDRLTQRRRHDREGATQRRRGPRGSSQPECCPHRGGKASPPEWETSPPTTPASGASPRASPWMLFFCLKRRARGMTFFFLKKKQKEKERAGGSELAGIFERSGNASRRPSCVRKKRRRFRCEAGIGEGKK